jgi:hypothetical protein
LNGYQHTAKDIVSYASMLGIGTQWLWEELIQPHSFELLFERVEARQQHDQIWQQRWPLVSLEQAIADLNTRLQKIRPQQFAESEVLFYPPLKPVEPGDFCV